MMIMIWKDDNMKQLKIFVGDVSSGTISLTKRVNEFIETMNVRGEHYVSTESIITHGYSKNYASRSKESMLIIIVHYTINS